MNRKTVELTETPKTEAVAASVLTVERAGSGEAGQPTVVKSISIDATPHKRQRRSDSDSSSEEEQLRKDGELIEAIINKKLSAEQRIEKISKALNQRANIHFQDGNRNNNTPLHLAVKRGQSEVVKFLLKQKGIDINIKNKDDKTALELAKEPNKSEEIVQALENYIPSRLENPVSEDRPREAVKPAVVKPQSEEETVIEQSDAKHKANAKGNNHQSVKNKDQTHIPRLKDLDK